MKREEKEQKRLTAAREALMRVRYQAERMDGYLLQPKESADRRKEEKAVYKSFLSALKKCRGRITSAAAADPEDEEFFQIYDTLIRLLAERIKKPGSFDGQGALLLQSETENLLDLADRYLLRASWERDKDWTKEAFFVSKRK